MLCYFSCVHMYFICGKMSLYITLSCGKVLWIENHLTSICLYMRVSCIFSYFSSVCLYPRLFLDVGKCLWMFCCLTRCVMSKFVNWQPPKPCVFLYACSKCIQKCTGKLLISTCGIPTNCVHTSVLYLSHKNTIKNPLSMFFLIVH